MDSVTVAPWCLNNEKRNKLPPFHWAYYEAVFMLVSAERPFMGPPPSHLFADNTNSTDLELTEG